MCCSFQPVIKVGHSGPFFLKMGQSRPLFVYFHYFLATISIIQIKKSIDGVLEIQTQGCRMIGADEITELWRPPGPIFFSSVFSIQLKVKRIWYLDSNRGSLVWKRPLSQLSHNHLSIRFNLFATSCTHTIYILSISNFITWFQTYPHIWDLQSYQSIFVASTFWT